MGTGEGVQQGKLDLFLRLYYKEGTHVVPRGASVARGQGEMGSDKRAEETEQSRADRTHCECAQHSCAAMATQRAQQYH